MHLRYSLTFLIQNNIVFIQKKKTMVRKNQPYHRKLERYKVCMVNREDKRVERMKFNYHYILLLKFKE